MISNCLKADLPKSGNDVAQGLTDLLKHKWPNLWKLHIFAPLHAENTYFPPHQISNIPAHGT